MLWLNLFLPSPHQRLRIQSHPSLSSRLCKRPLRSIPTPSLRVQRHVQTMISNLQVISDHDPNPDPDLDQGHNHNPTTSLTLYMPYPTSPRFNKLPSQSSSLGDLPILGLRSIWPHPRPLRLPKPRIRQEGWKLLRCLLWPVPRGAGSGKPTYLVESRNDVNQFPYPTRHLPVMSVKAVLENVNRQLRHRTKLRVVIVKSPNRLLPRRHHQHRVDRSSRLSHLTHSVLEARDQQGRAWVLAIS